MLVLLFIILALLGNIAHTELFYRVDFLFGSCIALMALVLLGHTAGILIGAIAASYTFHLWGHPYALIIWTFEIVWAAFLYRRLRFNLILAVGLYWLVIGMPLIFLFYGRIMGVEGAGLQLVAVKQAVNALTNAFIANSILMILRLKQTAPGFIAYKYELNLTGIVFNVLMGAMLLPMLAFIVIDSRDEIKRLDSLIKADIRSLSTTLDRNIRSWSEIHVQAIRSLADYAKDYPIIPSRELQNAVRLEARSFPDFHTVYIANAEGITAAFSPARNDKGESTIGLDFSDRDYFKNIKAGKDLVVSDVFLGRGGIFSPIATINVGIYDQQSFLGIASGALDLEHLQSMLPEYSSAKRMNALIVDSAGRTVASNNPAIAIMEPYGQADLDEQLDGSDGFFRRIPRMEGKPSMTRWEKSLIGQRTSNSQLGWTLIIEQPLEPYLTTIQTSYTRTMGLMLILVVAGGFVSWFIVNRISAPLSELTQMTNAASRRINLKHDFSWKNRGINEIDQLGQNFSTMMEALDNYVGRVREASTQLNAINENLRLEVEERQRAEESARLAQELAEAANRAKSEFLANMSHEMRTPLGIVLGYVELLQEPDVSREDASEFMATIKRNGQQLLDLINDVLDLAKVEAGMTEITIQDVELKQVIQDGILSFQKQAKNKGLTLSIALESSTPALIRTDPLRLRQILMNLVGNAVKFTESGSIQVDIRFDHQTRLLQFSVADTGIGISEEQAQKLFHMFTQADNSTTRRFGGTGLGLALSRRLARLLGGDIVITKSEPGVGSVFSLTLRVDS
jgi:signal transduction histidine kinase